MSIRAPKPAPMVCGNPTHPCPEPAMRRLPPCPDLRAFLGWLEGQGALAAIREPVSLRHEMTAVQLAALRRGGPALRFDRHDGPGMPVVANLFGTPARVAAGLGLLPGQ